MGGQVCVSHLLVVQCASYPVMTTLYGSPQKGNWALETEGMIGRLEPTLHKNTDTPFTADINAIRDRTYAAWLVNETYSYLYSSYLYIRLNQ